MKYSSAKVYRGEVRERSLEKCEREVWNSRIIGSCNVISSRELGEHCGDELFVVYGESK